MVSKIELTQGKYALVDSADSKWLNGRRWFYVGNGTAAYREKRSETGRQKRNLIYMHRLILSAPKEYEVDHINGNRLDNRRSNLRLCTSSQNKCNRAVLSRNKLQLKNICWYKSKEKYLVQIHKDKKLRFKGYFESVDEALLERDKALKSIHKEFARLT